jgi:hypothetical protein
MVIFFKPLREEVRARDAFYVIRQLGSVDDYAKSVTLLVVMVPQMPSEEQLYRFIKGLKTQVYVSFALQTPILWKRFSCWPKVPTGSSASNASTTGPAYSTRTRYIPLWN